MNRILAALTVAASAICIGTAGAAAPDTSPRPAARPDLAEVPVTRAATVPPLARMRPVPRPQSAQIEQLNQVAAPPATGPGNSLRPFLRPPEIAQKAFLFKRKQRRGSVCGNIDIQGEKVGRVPGRIRGCGVKNAVKVSSVSGVFLTQPSVMTCDTAEALNHWVTRGVRPAFKPMGRVAGLKVAAHYSCRTRNNRPGARISEHGKGKAIDISAFILDTGRTITVLKGWNQGEARKALKRAWQSACGPFGTVLGPGSDGYHRDHFHVDTARHRGGNYCR
ncbi:Uncharacterized conserved protein [Cribrihabitans marinus]|uniref:Uncharacterized conserved protein n=1 Tax=Cribrihabitans marinus TaxID=1227549 RepID=A0A1H7AEW0_9RHOB|nr:extensin family protein [Cribrihabitans marinus]GGH31590.1 hypothetical protein GCM10010973_22500 [Cribrihabitans marinus]SEJ64129.1 Uncharacterized conserved protein [Cribrihabitans marinus]